MTNDVVWSEKRRSERVASKSTGTASSTSEIPSVSTETVFELLADRHRRIVLAYLENTDDGCASISDLAAYVSQHVCTGNSPSKLKLQLYHIHLPKIDHANLIDYDSENKTVQYIGHPLVENCLNLIDSRHV